MTHLDEGQLHAYLDHEERDSTGAERQDTDRHLAECAECRAQLEAERRIRDRAHTLLGATGPAGVSAPPFDAVLERARRQRARPFRVPRTVALAWAASVALALTVGWYARSLVLGAGGGAAAAGVAGAAPESATAVGAAEAAGAADEMRVGTTRAAPPAARQLAQGIGADEMAGPERVTQVSQQEVRAEAPAAPATLQDRARANLAVAEAKAERDTGALVVGVTGAPVPSAAPAITLRRAVPAAEMAEEVWVTVTPAEAERRLGGPLATIPGLPSLRTTVFGTGPAVMTRTIQVLGPGLTIELVQERGSPPAKERAAVPAAPPEAAGRAAAAEPGPSITVQWEGFSVTGRALVPADSLRKLLSRLRRP